jgi:KaiC/GvpD/RAD55 family RecA-like ATPase
MQHSCNSAARARAPKTLTGIQGLDGITGGGLPTGLAALICGGAGSGKTLLATSLLAGLDLAGAALQKPR